MKYYNLGDDFENSQQLLETVWVLQNEMSSHSIQDPSEYIQLCIHTRPIVPYLTHRQEMSSHYSHSSEVNETTSSSSIRQDLSDNRSLIPEGPLTEHRENNQESQQELNHSIERDTSAPLIGNTNQNDSNHQDSANSLTVLSVQSSSDPFSPEENRAAAVLNVFSTVNQPRNFVNSKHPRHSRNETLSDHEKNNKITPQRSSTSTSEHKQKLCKQCEKSEMDTVLIPCGHLACCFTCAGSMANCPICKCQISTSVKTFIE